LNTWRGSRAMFTSVIHHYAKDPTVWIDGAWRHIGNTWIPNPILHPENEPKQPHGVPTILDSLVVQELLWACSWTEVGLPKSRASKAQLMNKKGNLRWRVSLAAEWVHSLEWLQDTGVGGVAPSSKRVREPYCSDSWANKVQLMNDWNEHRPSSSLALWFITCGVFRNIRLKHTAP
jgi:hypothetical protein